MAGLFGSALSAQLAATPDTSGQPTFHDRAMAALMALNGDFAGAMRMKQLPALRAQQKAAEDAINARLSPSYADPAAPAVDTPQMPGLSNPGQMNFGGATPAPQAPSVSLPTSNLPIRTQDPLSIESPDLAKLIFGGDQAGVVTKGLMDALKAQQPHVSLGPNGEAYNDKSASVIGRIFPNRQNINNTVIDTNDPTNTNRVIPSAPAGGGFLPRYDNLGHVVGWDPAPGVLGGTAAMERAKKVGETMGSIVERPDASGGVSTGYGADLYGDGGMGGGPRPAAPGVPGAPGAPAIPGRPGAGAGYKPSPQDQAYRDAQAKSAQAYYETTQSARRSAPGDIARLRAMDTLLKGFEGGHYAPAMTDMASAANSLGFNLDKNLPNKQTAQALGAQLTMELMKNPDTGANMFPRITNFEMQTFQKAVPGLMQTAQGRHQLVEIYASAKQRGADIGQMAQKWAQAYGRIDAPDERGHSFQDRLEAWSQSHPIYDPKLLKGGK